MTNVEPLDQRFNDLLCGFRAAGGLARDSEIVPRVAARHPEGCVWLARQIANRRLLFFTWQDALWFPVFQFEKADMSQHRGVARISAELVGWSDDWDRTHWFVRPHCALEDRPPIELIDAQPERRARNVRYEEHPCRKVRRQRSGEFGQGRSPPAEAPTKMARRKEDGGR